MNFVTKGKNIHIERIIPLYIEENNRILEDFNYSFRLVVIESGSMMLELNDKSIFLESPAVFCLNNRDNIIISNMKDTNIKTIYFRPEIINSKFGENKLRISEIDELSYTEYQDYVWLYPFIENDEDISRYIKLGPDSLNQVLKSYDQLKDELLNQYDGYWPCRSRSYFLEILFLLHNMQKSYEVFKSKIDNQIGELEGILLYIHTNYKDEISISTLVEKFNISRTKMNTMFIKTTGKSVIKYLIDIRIKLACLILRDTMKPIKEVAYQAGFRDITHFGRSFKKSVELSPSKYREQYNWMIN